MVTMRLKMLLCAAALGTAALSHGFQRQDLIGKQAPHTAFGTAVTGKPESLDLKQFRGRIVVLDFWATWCGPCVSSMPHLNELVAEFKGKPIDFIALSDEPAERITGFLADHPIAARVATDESQAALRAFGVTGIPTTIIFDKDGTVLHITHPMGLTKETLQSALDGKFKPSVPTADPVEPTGMGTAADILKFRGVFVPGQDPVYVRDDLRDLIDFNNYQTILRRAIFSMQMAGGGEAEGEVMHTALSQPALDLFAFLFAKSTPDYFVVDEGAVDVEARWDLIIHRLRDSSYDSVRREMRPIMESFFQVEFLPEKVEREAWVIKATPKAEEASKAAKNPTNVNEIIGLMAMTNAVVVVPESASVGTMLISSSPFSVGQSFDSMADQLRKMGFEIVREKRLIDGIRVRSIKK